MPLLLLLLLELVLRLIGYGYSPHFFIPFKFNGTNYLIENQKFSLRYFPPALARTPQPALFLAQKPAGVIRIFILGESAAMGDPEPAFGMARLVELLLQARYPEQKFEVINAAVTAINSHVIREIARDCAAAQGDFWIIYMGNNEVVGPFGAGTVFGAQVPGPALIRANLALKATRVGQLFDAVAMKLSKSRYPSSWEGMEMFLKQQVAADDPRMPKVYEHFERNLRDIAASGKRAGAHLLLSTVASNLKECAPFASLHSRALSDASRKEWENAHLAGAEAMAQTNYAAALEQFRGCEQKDSKYAELRFRMGQSLLLLKKADEARSEFEAARDLDTLRFRADSHLNSSIRRLASGDPEITLVDAVQLFATNSLSGIPGRELLLEHVHMTFAGNYLLARAFAESVQVPGDSKIKNNGQWLSMNECAARLALTDWDRLQLAEEMVRRLGQAPFTQQLDHKPRLASWQSEVKALRKACEGTNSDGIIAVYRKALDVRSTDWVLHENFAKLLQSMGDPAGAEQQWRKVLELLPHSEQALYSLANVLDAEGKSAEALTYFNLALQRRPGSLEARNGLGVALSNQGKTEEAINQYRQALRRNPRFTEARINLGQALAQLGRNGEAIAEYEATIKADPGSSAAHINLGKLLASNGRAAEAEQEYRAALGINSNDAVAHYNLGNLLAGQRRPESVEQFEAAIRANPNFAEAHFNLGLGYASANRNADAVAQFKEATRIRPQWAEAQLNLGVALAKEHQYAEAITAFTETLRLEPGNADAKRFLAQAQKLQSRQN